MRCVQALSALALRRLLSPCPEPVGSAAVGILPPDCPDPRIRRHVTRALHQANARAWTVVQVVLAGESLWERFRQSWQPGKEKTLYRPVRILLDTIENAPLEEIGPDAQPRCWQALQAALPTGLLTAGDLEVTRLLDPLSALGLGGADDPQTLEGEVLGRLAHDLAQAGYDLLRPLLALRWPGQGSLLVTLVAAFFRHVVEADPDQYGDFPFPPGEEFGAAADDLNTILDLIDYHRGELDLLLEEVRVQAGSRPAAAAEDGSARLQHGLAFSQHGDYDQAIAQFTAALQSDPALVTAFVRRGEAYRLKGEYERALADYDAAIERDPGNPQAYFNRGLVLWMTGRHEAAVADYSAALRLDPNNAIALNNRGSARAELDDLAGAVNDFTEAIRLDPAYAWAYHNRGDARVRLGEYDSALADYSLVFRHDPLSALTYVKRGDVCRFRGEYDRAVADYGNALRLDPLNVPAYISRGATYRLQGQYELSVTDFDRALRLDASNATILYQRALTQRSAGDLKAALADFDGALALAPETIDILYQRGCTHQLRGDAERALTDFDAVLQLDPAHAPACNSRGSLHARAGRMGGAFADFNAALRLDPDFTLAYVNRASVWARQGRYEEAAADCSAALERDASLVRAYVVRGNAHVQCGNFAAARADFDRAIELDPTTAQPYYLRGLAALKEGDAAGALADLTECVRLDPQHHRAFALRGMTHHKGKRHELALADFLQALLLDPRYAAVYCTQRGLLHASQGRHDQAVADYTLALRFDADNTVAQIGFERTRKVYRERPPELWAYPPAPVKRSRPARPAPAVEQPASRDTDVHQPAATEVYAPVPEGPPANETDLTEEEGLWRDPADGSRPPSASAKGATTTAHEPVSAPEQEKSEEFVLSDDAPTAEAAPPRPEPEPTVADEQSEAQRLQEERRRELEQRARKMAEMKRKQEAERQKNRPPLLSFSEVNLGFWVRALGVAAVIALIVGVGLYVLLGGPVKVSANELYEQFAADAKGASAKYGGKTLQVTGTVETSSLAGSKVTIVYFKPSDKVKWKIICKLPKDVVKSIKSGQELTVHGTCPKRKSANKDLNLANCVLK